MGSLIYLSATRPDISQDVHVLRQFVSAPTLVHYATLFRVLCFLRSTISRSLLYNSDLSLSLQVYSDIEWADDPDTRCSTIGFCIFLGSSLISLRSKRQDVVSRSNTEAEYHAMVDTTLEFQWLSEILCDMGISMVAHVPMHCDSKSVIVIASKLVFHDRTKHIEIGCHITCQEYKKGKITLPYILFGAQLADLFTKAQTSAQFREILFKLSICDPP